MSCLKDGPNNFAKLGEFCGTRPSEPGNVVRRASLKTRTVKKELDPTPKSVLSNPGFTLADAPSRLLRSRAIETFPFVAIIFSRTPVPLEDWTTESAGVWAANNRNGSAIQTYIF